MKFFFDRNWSPHLAAAIRALCIPIGVEVVYHDDRFARNCPDVEWITTLGQEGDWAIITKDRLSKSPAEREALRRTGLVTFIFKDQWSHHKDWDQSWALVRWWPAIMEVANRMRGGAFLVPYKFSGNGKMEPLKL